MTHLTSHVPDDHRSGWASPRRTAGLSADDVQRQPSSGSCYRSEAGRRAVVAEAISRLERWGEPHHSETISTSLGDTHLLRCGIDAPAVLFLPGTNMCSAAVLGALSVLASRATIVAADLPGQPGLSDPRQPSGGVDSLGRWADDVVAALGSRPVTVVGHSLGAAVALSMTPSPSIAGLVLVNPAGLVGVRPSPRLLITTTAWLAHPTRRSAARLVRYMSGSTDVAGEPDGGMAEWMRLVGQHCRPRGAPQPLPDSRFEAWASTPVAIVAGGRDRFFPLRRLRRRARRLGLEVEASETAGHLLIVEQPNALATVLDGRSPQWLCGSL